MIGCLFSPNVSDNEMARDNKFRLSSSDSILGLFGLGITSKASAGSLPCLMPHNTATSRISFYWIAYSIVQFYRLKSVNDWPSAEMIVLYLCPPKAPWPIFSVWGWLQSTVNLVVRSDWKLHLRLQLPLRGASMWVSLGEGSLHFEVCCSTICWGLMYCRWRASS